MKEDAKRKNGSQYRVRGGSDTLLEHFCTISRVGSSFNKVFISPFIVFNNVLWIAFVAVSVSRNWQSHRPKEKNSSTESRDHGLRVDVTVTNLKSRHHRHQSWSRRHRKSPPSRAGVVGRRLFTEGHRGDRRTWYKKLQCAKKSVRKYQNIRCKGLILAILGHFGAFWACQKFSILE